MGRHCEEGYHACVTQGQICLNGGQCYYLPSSIHTPLCDCLQGREMTILVLFYTPLKMNLLVWNILLKMLFGLLI